MSPDWLSPRRCASAWIAIRSERLSRKDIGVVISSGAQALGIAASSTNTDRLPADLVGARSGTPPVAAGHKKTAHAGGGCGVPEAYGVRLKGWPDPYVRPIERQYWKGGG
jgi:hypothetical protein